MAAVSGNRRSWSAPALLALALLSGACADTGSPGLGEVLAGARLETSDGRVIEPERLRGRPVLLSFWSTTCPSCLEEIPRLKALHRELGGRGLQLIGIAMPHDRPDLIVALDRRLEITYPLVFDPVGELNRVFKTRQITPTHLLISPAGEEVYRHQGPLDTARLRRVLRAMLQG